MSEYQKPTFDDEQNRVRVKELESSKRYKTSYFELIIIIIVITILAAMFVPVLIEFVGSSKIQQANANAKNIYAAAVAVDAGLGNERVLSGDLQELTNWTTPESLENNTYGQNMLQFLDVSKMEGYFKFELEDGHVAQVLYLEEDNSKCLGSAPVSASIPAEENIVVPK